MIVFYVAGPFRGATAWHIRQNVHAAEQLGFALTTAAIKQGTPVAVIVPHSLGANFNGTHTDSYWLDATKAILHRCDALLLTENWRTSAGAVAEFAAFRHKDRRFTSVDEALRYVALTHLREGAYRTGSGSDQ